MIIYVNTFQSGVPFVLSEKFSIKRQLDKTKVLRSSELILVYQMGKVGSSTIKSGLKELSIPNYHIHTFDDHEEFLIFKNHKEIKKFFDFKNRIIYRFILKYRLYCLKTRDKIKIITFIRDPISTMVSRFFQDLHLTFIEGKKDGAIHGDIIETCQYLEECFEKNINREYFTNWFDNELRANFGIDVLSSNIDSGESTYIFHNDKVRVLFVKCESINDSVEEISNFIKRDFQLIQSNRASNKWYSLIYNKFIEEYDFSKLFYLYDLPLYKRFYSDIEIERMKSKWIK
ncbi:putative capsular polysaccharide synthesis family protein [Vibrio chagasii]|uniref:putative capsular polysaccharide synthesis family protein n=1 Tax=Vibrio chagasii TaxID=170679 RepID=UPI003DAA2D12